MLYIDWFRVPWDVIQRILLLVLLTIIIIRVKPEEDMLLDRFGDEYKEYMTRTGRFLPKLLRKRK